MSDDRPKSKRPANTAFKQQRLKAWQPILTPKTVLPAFFIVGLIFVPLGIGLYIASEKVNEVMFDYTECKAQTPSATFSRTPGRAPIEEWRWDGQTCFIHFRISEILVPPVFLYYRLTNFYQNHRRYVKSFDANQLKGDQIGVQNLDKQLTNCDPLREAAKVYAANLTVIVNGGPQEIKKDAQVYPCGLIANSMFSDEISTNLSCIKSDFTGFPDGQTCANVKYAFSESGIAWPSDKEKYGVTQWKDRADDVTIATTLVPPPLWREAFPQWKDGYNFSNLPNLHEWERFQVWMRTAALPTFRKLYARTTGGGSALPPGLWEISIRDTFDVAKFSGTKSIVISTVSILGGKNPFLGAAYMAVGVICWVLGIVFLIRHMIKPRKLGDHTYLSWNQPQQNQARAPGVPEVGGERSSLIGGR